MTAQPSASWKLSAISVPFCSVQTIKVSESRDTVSKKKDTKQRWDDNGGIGTLLFLVAIILGDSRFE